MARGGRAPSARLAAVALAATVAFGACSAAPSMGRDHMEGTPSSIGRGMNSGTVGHSMTRDEADYLVTMVAHHREAIVASAALARSARPELRGLGRTIRRTQSAEVRMMVRWTDRWYPTATAATDYRPMMSDLSSLSGNDLDRTFLTEMVHHHMMAVMMSRHLVLSGQVRHPGVAALAESIIDAQTAEIALMRQWLREWDLR